MLGSQGLCFGLAHEQTLGSQISQLCIARNHEQRRVPKGL